MTLRSTSALKRSGRWCSSRPSSEELGTDLAREIRCRAEELIGLRAKKTSDLAAAQRAAAEHPTPATAQSLLGALPLLAIDWRLLQDRQFRDLLQSLGFEARHDPEARVLNVRVVLVPELLLPPEGTKGCTGFDRASNPTAFEPCVSGDDRAAYGGPDLIIWPPRGRRDARLPERPDSLGPCEKAPLPPPTRSFDPGPRRS